MEEEYVSIDLRELFSLLLRKIGWIILAALVCGIAAYAVNWYVLKPVYQADSMVIVNTREEQNVVVTNDQINSARQLVTTYEVILKSDTVLEQVLNAVENRGLLDSHRMSLNELKNAITVASVNNTQVMRISGKSEDKDLALAIVDEILTVAPSIIIRTVKAGSVEVVSYPKLNNVPVSPHKTRNLVFSVMGGALAAAAIIVLREMLDNTIKTDDDIRKKLELPVLGVIPRIRENDLNDKSSEKKGKEKKAGRNG